MFKRMLSSLLVAVMVMQLPLQALAFPDVGSGESFSDAVLYLKENDVIKGYPDGSFKPLKEINRAELLKILIGGIGVTPDSSKYKDCFPDVKDQWFAPYVCYAKEKGFIEGYPDGTFKPEKTANHVETLKMAFLVQGIAVESARSGDKWYERFVRKARDLNLSDGEVLDNPGSLMKRALMAELIARSSISKATGGKKFVKGATRIFRDKKILLKEIHDDELRKSIPTVINGDFDELLRKDAEKWIVKVTPKKEKSPKEYDIDYSHHKDPFVSFEGIKEEVFVPPTIHIVEKTGYSKMGLNGDMFWDGHLDPAEDYLKFDADVSGPEKKSQNLRYWMDDMIVKISSEMQEHVGTFDLNSGKITGDVKITKGYDSLQDYFKEHDNEPFEVCVTDDDKREGRVGIFADYRTVAIGECKIPFYDEPPVKEPPFNSVVIGGPGGLVAGPPPGGPGGPGAGGPGAGGAGGGGGGADGAAGGAGDWGFPEGEGADGDGNSSEDTREADDSPEPPKGVKNLGEDMPDARFGMKTNFQKYEVRKHEIWDIQQKAYFANKKAFEQNEEALKSMMKQFGVPIPTKPLPAISFADCFPPGAELACEKLAEDPATALKEYSANMKCVNDKIKSVYADYAKNLVEAQHLAGRVGDLKGSEAQFKFLLLFIKGQKYAVGVVAELLTGGPAKAVLKNFIKGLVGDLLGDLASFATGEGMELDPGNPNSPEDKFKRLGKATFEKLWEESGMKDKLEGKAGELADKLGLEGNERKRFIKNFMDQFGKNPFDLLDPANWIKFVINAVFIDSVGGVVEDFVDTVEDLRKRRNEALQKAWLLVQQLKGLEDWVFNMRKVCVPKADAIAQVGYKQEESKEKAYWDRVEKEEEYILKVALWVLKHDHQEIFEGNPSKEEVIERVMKRVRAELRRKGMNYCWVDITITVEWKKTVSGYKWDVTVSIRPRKTKKPNCPNPELEKETTVKAPSESTSRGGSSDRVESPATPSSPSTPATTPTNETPKETTDPEAPASTKGPDALWAFDKEKGYYVDLEGNKVDEGDVQDFFMRCALKEPETKELIDFLQGQWPDGWYFDPETYQWFDKDGEPISEEEMNRIMNDFEQFKLDQERQRQADPNKRWRFDNAQDSWFDEANQKVSDEEAFQLFESFFPGHAGEFPEINELMQIGWPQNWTVNPTTMEWFDGQNPLTRQQVQQYIQQQKANQGI